MADARRTPILALSGPADDLAFLVDRSATAELDPGDGRFTNAILTETGFHTLAEAAPGHLAHVRALVIDVLSPEQLRAVGMAADQIMSRINTSAIN